MVREPCMGVVGARGMAWHASKAPGCVVSLARWNCHDQLLNAWRTG